MQLNNYFEPCKKDTVMRLKWHFTKIYFVKLYFATVVATASKFWHGGQVTALSISIKWLTRICGVASSVIPQICVSIPNLRFQYSGTHGTTSDQNYFLLKSKARILSFKDVKIFTLSVKKWLISIPNNLRIIY